MSGIKELVISLIFSSTQQFIFSLFTVRGIERSRSIIICNMARDEMKNHEKEVIYVLP